VAPTVWAWRPGRAKKIAQYLDGLVCLFPFEPAYFTKHGLHAIYCGHPLSELQVDQIDKDWFDKRFEVSEGHKKIGLFLGSRESELKTIAPVIVEAVNGLYEHYQDFSVIIPTLPRLELDITNIASSLPCEAFVLCDDQHKWESFMACDMAVAVSGTVALELAYLGVPHFVAYKVHPITWILLKILVKTQYAHIANIVADKEVIPELLQWKCSALEIAKMLMSFIKTPEILEKQKRDMAYLRTELCSPTDKKPSENIADYLLSVLR